jgi:hypothetical protein
MSRRCEVWNPERDEVVEGARTTGSDRFTRFPLSLLLFVSSDPVVALRGSRCIRARRVTKPPYVIKLETEAKTTVAAKSANAPGCEIHRGRSDRNPTSSPGRRRTVSAWSPSWGKMTADERRAGRSSGRIEAGDDVVADSSDRGGPRRGGECGVGGSGCGLGRGTGGASRPARLEVDGRERENRQCYVVTFKSNGTFHDDVGQTGTWSGGGKTLSMTWNAGINSFSFSGTFTKTPTKEYGGYFVVGEVLDSGQVVKGSVSGC